MKQRPNRPDALSVLVANLAGQDERQFGRALGRTVAHMLQDNYDLVLLQEIRQYALDGLADVSGGLSMQHLMTSRINPDGEQMGIVSLGPPTIRHSTGVMFENPRLLLVEDPNFASHDKGALVTKYDWVNGSELTVVNLHALPFYRFGIADDDPLVWNIWKTFGESLGAASPLGGHTIIGGDFNLQDLSAVRHTVIPRGYSPVVASQPTRPDGRSTDNLFHSASLTLRSMRLFDVGSDHFALALLLEPEDRSP